MADWIDAADDGQAIAKAHALRPDAYRCELRHKTRLVARLNHLGEVVQRFDVRRNSPQRFSRSDLDASSTCWSCPLLSLKKAAANRPQPTTS